MTINKSYTIKIYYLCEMRILVLSRNPELYSTRSIVLAAKRRGHFVRVVDHMTCDVIIQKGGHEVVCNGYTITDFDAVIPRIGHTATRHGLALIRQFEAQRMYSTLSSRALEMTRSKLACLQLLSANGIDIPKTIYAHSAFAASDLAVELGDFPAIVKLISGTHGLGVIKADNQSLLDSIVESFYGTKQKVLIQQFIKESAGEDVRAFVVDGKVVASMLRKAQPGEFRSNLHRGATAVKVELSGREREVALQSAKILGLGIAGVDMLRSKNGPLVLEVNASPGLEGIENTTRVDVAKTIVELVEKKGRR